MAIDTEQTWTLAAYDRAQALTQIIRRNKDGQASWAELSSVADGLAVMIRKTAALASASAICAMPRRAPGAASDMAPIAAAVADKLGIKLVQMARTSTPCGGRQLRGRARFSADSHATSLRYSGGTGRVIVLDNVLTTGGTMAGACRAIRSAHGTPLALAVLRG